MTIATGRGITIKESAMDTNRKTKTNTKTSTMSEIRELTDDELNAVNGGAVVCLPVTALG